MSIYQNNYQFLQQSLLNLYEERKKSFLSSLGKILQKTYDDPWIQKFFEDSLSTNFIPKRIDEIVINVLTNDREEFLIDLLFRLSLNEVCFGKEKQNQLEKIGKKLLRAIKNKKEQRIIENYKKLLNWIERLQDNICSRTGILPSLTNSTFPVAIKKNINQISSLTQILRSDCLNFFKSMISLIQTYKNESMIKVSFLMENTTNKKEAFSKITFLQSQIDCIKENSINLQNYYDDCQTFFGGKNPEDVLAEKDRCIDNLTNQIKQLSEKLHKTQDKFQNLKKRAKKFNQEIEKLIINREVHMDTRLIQINNEKNDLMQHLRENSQNIENSQKIIIDLKEENQENQKEIYNKKIECEKLLNEIEVYKEQDKNNILKIKQLSYEKKSHMDEIQRLTTENEQSKKQNQFLEDQLKQTKILLVEKEEKLKKAISDCNEIESLKSKIDSLQQQLKEKDSVIEQFHQDLIVTKKNRIDSECKIKELENTMKHKLDSNQNIINNYKNELERMKKKNQSLSQNAIKMENELRQNKQKALMLKDQVDKNKEREILLDKLQKEFCKLFDQNQKYYDSIKTKFENILKENKNLTSNIDATNYNIYFDNRIKYSLKINNLDQFVTTYNCDDIENALNKNLELISKIFNSFMIVLQENRELHEKFNLQRKDFQMFEDSNLSVEKHFKNNSPKTTESKSSLSVLKRDNRFSADSSKNDSPSLIDQTNDDLQKTLIKTQNDLEIVNQNYQFSIREREKIETKLFTVKRELNQVKNSLENLQNDILMITDKDSIKDIPMSIRELKDNTTLLKQIKKELNLDTLCQIEVLTQLQKLKNQSKLYNQILEDSSINFHEPHRKNVLIDKI